MIWTIVRKEIALTLKDKGTFFWLFALPIVFIVMFASIFSQSGGATYTIPYVDEDGSALSGQLIDMLSQVKGYEPERYEGTGAADGIREVKEGGLSYLLVIPQGYGERVSGGEAAEVKLYRDAAADVAAAPVIALLDSVTGGLQQYKLRNALTDLGLEGAAIEALMEPAVMVSEVKENAAKADPITQIVPGYTVMFVFFIMINMILGLLKDRQSGMLARLQSTPMKPLHYLCGMWVPHVLVLLIQSAVLLSFGRIAYGLQIGNPLAIALIVIGLAVCATGLGLMLSMLVSSENTGIAVVQVITMGGAIVGGLWFPYEMLPRAVQAVGQFTPQYWAQRGMQDVMIRGAGAADIGWTLLVLFAFGLGGLIVAWLRFRKFAMKTV